MTAYDVWSKEMVGIAVVGEPFTVDVPASGAARLFRLKGI